MSRAIFLLEELSMKVLLDGLLPRLFPGLDFLCIPHEGKQDLEKSIVRKLKAWREPGASFFVVRDNDGGDCTALKARLAGLCRKAGRDDALVRITCQELEAWYFGEPGALARAFNREELRQLSEKARYRNPDAIVQPARTLATFVSEFQKISGARRMAKYLSRDNTSASFQAFISGVERILTSEHGRGGVGP